MANIQQSINSMLSSGTAAAFLATQTPAYKEKAAKGSRLKTLAREEKELERKMDIIGSTKGPASDEEYANVYDKIRDIEVERATLKPTAENVKRAEEIYGEREEEYAADLKKRNEQAAMKAYTDRVITLENTLAALNERKDLLSAKQRGQLSTITHTIAKKGGLN